MERAMRSLIEPPGLALSSLTKRRQGPVSNPLSSTIGVAPIRSRAEATAGGAKAGGLGSVVTGRLRNGRDVAVGILRAEGASELVIAARAAQGTTFLPHRPAR